MKKILMMLDNPFQADARVEKEAKALVGAGYEVVVLATAEGEDLPKTEKRDGYSISRIIDTAFKHPYRSGYQDFQEKMAQRVAAMEFQYLHAHDYHMLHIGARVKELRPDIKLIYDAHEYLNGWPLHLDNKGISNKLKGYLVRRRKLKEERAAVARVDAFITISNGIAGAFKQDLRLNYTPGVVRNLPEYYEVQGTDDYFRKHFGLQDSDVLIVHSGSVYYTPNQLKKLYKAVVERDHLKLIFVGNRPIHTTMKARVDQDPTLKTSIFFHDYANPPLLLEWLSSADIGLMHVRSRWKAHILGFANRFMEYSMAGIPVISTEQQANKEIGEKFGHAVYYEENNFDSFQLALDNMLNSLSIYKKRAMTVGVHANWSTEAEKLIALYQTI